MAKTVIGFVGLGIMGEAMCGRLLRVTDHAINIYAKHPRQLTPFQGTRAQPMDSVATLGKGSSHVIIMVPDSEDVAAVVDELLPVLRPGSRVIDMSTIDPEVSRQLAAKVAATGAAMIDAPVVKSRAAAEAGELGIYVGGQAEVVRECMPLLRQLGSAVLPLGPNGSGLAMKLCHNMLVAQIQNGVNEAVALARQAGLSFEQVVEAIACGGARNFYLEAKAEALRREDFAPKFPLTHMHKDLRLTLALAESLGVTLPGAEHALSVYDEALREERGGQDFAATIKTVEAACRRQSVTVRAPEAALTPSEA